MSWWQLGAAAISAAGQAKSKAPEVGGAATMDSSGWVIAWPGASATTAEGFDAQDAELKKYLLYFALAAGAVLIVKALKR